MTVLTETLRLHALWLEGAEGGKRADLTHANLTDAALRGANLTAPTNERYFFVA